MAVSTTLIYYINVSNTVAYYMAVSSMVSKSLTCHNSVKLKTYRMAVPNLIT
jgi:hypothetical protein